MGSLTSHLPVTFEELSALSQEDELLQTVKRFIKSRWPDLETLCQHPKWSQLEGFHRRREALTIEQECVLFRNALSFQLY